jgi:hypothetical protein
MVSQRELQEVVTQINGILERLDKRLQSVEAVQKSLLHDLKSKEVTIKKKKNG